MDFRHSADLNASIGEAIEMAVKSRHETIGVDHLFWAMLKQPELKERQQRFLKLLLGEEIENG